ncbi:uncharacterized protein LOC135162578 [Diachasmimorpha longicaudata]|uniref:uncharacterized protein LOC135162578 n=1 Tax=Diachasmimorpha longicaudata TaxID=58733 RepID=UPI0030B8CF89
MKITVKFSLHVVSVLLLLPLSGHCQGQSQYPHIINEGFSILSYANAMDINSGISTLYNQLRNYDREFTENLSLMDLFRLYGDPQTLLTICDGHMGVKMDAEQARSGGQAYCALIREFITQIRNIQARIEKIGDYYRRSIEDWEGQNSAWKQSVDEFYRSVTSGCENDRNRSRCFFHRVAGNEFKQFLQKIPAFSTRSIHQEVYLSYLKVSIALLKCYAEEIVRIRRNSPWSSQQMEVEKWQAEFAVRVASFGRMAIDALRVAPRDIMPRDPYEHIEGRTYIRLKWFIEQIIVNEANLHKDASCWNTCNDYDTAEFKPYGDVPMEEHDVCHGMIHKCYLQSLGPLCSPVPHMSRRYGGIKGITQMQNRSICNEWTKKTDDLYWVQSSIFDRCDVCTCLCDDFRDPYTVRTFSLRPVTSDIDSNMVITGVRFQEAAGVIHIQIQEARLLRRGGIDGFTRRWVPVEGFSPPKPGEISDDYFTMRYLFERSVSLNTVSTGDQHVRELIMKNSPRRTNYSWVLTGVRLTRGKASAQLVIGIRLTAADMTSGMLVQANDWDGWVYPEHQGGTYEVNIEEPDISIYGPEWNVEVEGDSLYVKFQPTDNIKDFGQTTVPFLDSQDVVAEPPIPLSGVGLYYKGQKGYGGFIGLKLMSFDFTELVATEASRWSTKNSSH